MTGDYTFAVDTAPRELIFTENDTNLSKVDEEITQEAGIFTKDAFHEYIINGQFNANRH